MYDAHVHLQDERLAPVLDGVLAEARAAGVGGACCCASHPGDWDATAALPARAEAFGLRLQAAFGIHPWYCDGLPADWLDRLEGLLTAWPAAAMGEIGLDGLRPEPPREVQRRVFDAQLALAARLGRTVVVHAARAWGAVADALRPWSGRLPGFAVHGFAASAPVLADLAGQGAYFSFAGTVCNPVARRVHEAAARVPADRLLVETDAPDLFPAGGRPALPDTRLNQPANLPLVIAALARQRGLPAADVAALTTANAARLFGFVAASKAQT
jgi:TatD DNase family protein